MENVNTNFVALIKTLHDYPSKFDPPKLFPEFKDLNIHNNFNPNNHIYSAVRELLKEFGFDTTNFGKSNWNPLSAVISPGDTVVIKPNLVKHTSENPLTTMESLITHPSIIIAVLDYVILALQNKGEVVIGDSPIQEADFEITLNYLKIKEKIDEYSKKFKIKFRIEDFRKERSIYHKYSNIKRFELKGDSKGYKTIFLNEKSQFAEISEDYKKFRVTNYDKDKMFFYHTKNKHGYIISGSVIDADVIISLPKLKTHRKAGLTCALKNLIGINGSKDCLPHHRKGSIEEGGDEYLHKSWRKKIFSNIEEKKAKCRNKLLGYFYTFIKGLIYFSEFIVKYKDPYKEGSWYGNKTIPRTIVDLNYIVKYANKKGVITPEQQRKYLVITDAIICGENDGPLNPTEKPLGFLIGAQDPIVNDITASVLMGFDYKKIPSITFAINSMINTLKIESLDDISVNTNITNINNLKDLREIIDSTFIPTKGWKNHIEYNHEK